MMSYINTGQLRKLGANAPLTQDDNLVCLVARTNPIESKG